MSHLSLNIRFLIGNHCFQILRITNGTYSGCIPRHSHSHKSYEIHYVEEGYGEVLIDNNVYELSPNTAYITGPNIEHEQRSSTTSPMKEFSLYCEVTPISDNNLDTFESEDIVSIFLNTSFWIGQDSQGLKELIYKLENEIQNHYIGYHTIIRSIFENIIVSMVRNYNNVRTSSVNIPSPTINDNRLIIIENSFLTGYRDLTLESLSNRLGLSKRQTSRILQDYYKATFQEKKMQARMSAAMNLLLTSQMSIGEVAEVTGFSSTEYFCNAFKRYYGKTASYYKNQRSKDSKTKFN